MRRAAVLAASAVLLAGCAAAGVDDTAQADFDEGYTPTGSLIPRKNADRDGKRVILSREQAQKGMQELERQNNAVLAR
ncbi:hypothetical protein IP92_02122 [Pseudoduganella flava]|uniref:Lipoprotein n=1 Tax=Pseudoduganella flava TaxID=871742 RepID=A0A562PWE2_9BURK|nr:hypothetical protein [Pseudoduganella flava]QGZ39810.1 hypothetical protein GO485_12610 [Pseudoduganella flava]TWI48729.1 hypothetical protein IP92_02122 [Pseudoduganella flava]